MTIEKHAARDHDSRQITRTYHQVVSKNTDTATHTGANTADKDLSDKTANQLRNKSKQPSGDWRCCTRNATNMMDIIGMIHTTTTNEQPSAAASQAHNLLQAGTQIAWVKYRLLASYSYCVSAASRDATAALCLAMDSRKCNTFCNTCKWAMPSKKQTFRDWNGILRVPWATQGTSCCSCFISTYSRAARQTGPALIHSASLKAWGEKRWQLTANCTCSTQVVKKCKIERTAASDGRSAKLKSSAIKCDGKRLNNGPDSSTRRVTTEFSEGDVVLLFCDFCSESALPVALLSNDIVDNAICDQLQSRNCKIDIALNINTYISGQTVLWYVILQRCPERATKSKVQRKKKDWQRSIDSPEQNVVVAGYRKFERLVFVSVVHHKYRFTEIAHFRKTMMDLNDSVVIICAMQSVLLEKCYFR